MWKMKIETDIWWYLLTEYMFQFSWAYSYSNFPASSGVALWLNSSQWKRWKWVIHFYAWPIKSFLLINIPFALPGEIIEALQKGQDTREMELTNPWMTKGAEDLTAPKDLKWMKNKITCGKPPGVGVYYYKASLI